MSNAQLEAAIEAAWETRDSITPATGGETRERAEVLSTVGGVVLRIGDRIEVLRDDGLPGRHAAAEH